MADEGRTRLRALADDVLVEADQPVHPMAGPHDREITRAAIARKLERP